MVEPEPKDEQRLRAASRHERGVHLRSDESLDAQAFGSLMRLFGRSQKGSSANFALTAFSEVSTGRREVAPWLCWKGPTRRVSKADQKGGRPKLCTLRCGA